MFVLEKKESPAMPIRAMIIEDDLLSSTMLCDLLEDHFPEIEIVGVTESVKDSLQFLEDHKIDLLFLDIELPDGNGFDILCGTKNKRFGVIITTSYQTYAADPQPGNLVDFIVKPVTLNTLRNAIQKYIQQIYMHLTV
jgi:two-component system, LytTR family, response regulator